MKTHPAITHPALRHRMAVALNQLRHEYRFTMRWFSNPAFRDNRVIAYRWTARIACKRMAALDLEPDNEIENRQQLDDD